MCVFYCIYTLLYSSFILKVDYVAAMNIYILGELGMHEQFTVNGIFIHKIRTLTFSNNFSMILYMLAHTIIPMSIFYILSKRYFYKLENKPIKLFIRLL